MESLAAWTFTIVSAIGVVVTYLLLVDAKRDKEAVTKMADTNGRTLIVKASMRMHVVKLIVFLLFLLAGLLVITPPTPVPGILRLLLTAGVILLMLNSVLDYRAKKRLLST